MCGKDSGCVPVIIEGVDMLVCDSCSGFGRVMQRPQTPKFVKRSAERQKRPLFKQEEVYVIDEYGSILKRARQSQGLLMKDFCKELNIKESHYGNVESGKTKPSIELAKKLERKLGVTILGSSGAEEYEVESSDGGALTIGDMIKKD